MFEELLKLAPALGVYALVLLVAVAALVKWLLAVWENRVKEWDRTRAEKALDTQRQEHDRLLERVRAELDRVNFVHRVQFEKEFHVYEALWAKLVDLGSAALQLRPIMEYLPAGKNQDEIRREKLERLHRAFDGIPSVIEHNRPFYSPEVYEAARGIFHMAEVEGRQYQDGREGRGRDYWDEAAANAGKISDVIQKTCEAIRRRVHALPPTLVEGPLPQGSGKQQDPA